MLREGPVLDSQRLIRVGGQLGSNPAGLYQDADGQRYYIKSLESRDLARNEWLAAQLYQLAGAPTLEYVATQDPLQIATVWRTLDKCRLSQFSDDERRQAQAWFGVHAWTANWDAAGLLGDNQGVWQGRVLTLDVGGALAYRACGDPKGRAFGNGVNEIDRLRTDPDNPQAVRLFGDMEAAALHQAIARVLRIPAEQIRACVLDNGGCERLADKLIARQADMARQLEEQLNA